MEIIPIILSLSLGLGLAAACGFRVFIPPLMMGVASRFDLYELEGSYVWVDISRLGNQCRSFRPFA